jgi:hypothetical protein
VKVIYTHVCGGCDWQPDPRARAGVETQIERHMAATKHSVVTHGRPEKGEQDAGDQLNRP